MEYIKKICCFKWIFNGENIFTHDQKGFEISKMDFHILYGLWSAGLHI